MSTDAEARLRADFPDLLPRVWRYGFILSDDADAAQDLAQATCLRVLEKIGDMRRGRPIAPWVFEVAHRIWSHEIQALGLVKAKGDGILAEPAALNRLMKLPQVEAEYIILHDLEGFDLRELSQILKRPKRQIEKSLEARDAGDISELKVACNRLLDQAPTLVIPDASFATLKARHRRTMARVAAGAAAVFVLIVLLVTGAFK